jgi:hypothetical protein
MQNIVVAIAVLIAIISGTVSTSENNSSGIQGTTAEGPRYQ